MLYIIYICTCKSRFGSLTKEYFFLCPLDFSILPCFFIAPHQTRHYRIFWSGLNHIEYMRFKILARTLSFMFRILKRNNNKKILKYSNTLKSRLLIFLNDWRICRFLNNFCVFFFFFSFFRFKMTHKFFYTNI